MQELLSNQWINYSILLLNAIVAGQILWFAINIKSSKIFQYVIFTLGMSYAIAIGGIFKAPGFILNPEVEVFWLFVNALFGMFIIAIVASISLAITMTQAPKLLPQNKI